jgi:hypothetical protein
VKNFIRNVEGLDSRRENESLSSFCKGRKRKLSLGGGLLEEQDCPLLLIRLFPAVHGKATTIKLRGA